MNKDETFGGNKTFGSSSMLTKRTENVRRFFRDETGVTAIEYGMIAAGIAVAIIVTVFAIGPELNDAFNTVLQQLQSSGGTATGD